MGGLSSRPLMRPRLSEFGAIRLLLLHLLRLLTPSWVSKTRPDRLIWFHLSLNSMISFSRLAGTKRSLPQNSCGLSSLDNPGLSSGYRLVIRSTSMIHTDNWIIEFDAVCLHRYTAAGQCLGEPAGRNQSGKDGDKIVIGS